MKTYTLTASSITRYTSSTRSLLSAGTQCQKVTAASSNYVGHGSTYRALRIEFDHDTIEHLRTVGINSIKLRVNVSTSYSYLVLTYAGRCTNLSDTHCYVDDPKKKTIQSGLGVQDIDVTNIGIPQTSYAYAIGGTQSSQSGDYYKIITGTVQLIVTTNESDYTITYDGNGGEGAPSPQAVFGEGAVSVTLSDTVPTLTGKLFLGWSENNASSEADYAAGSTILVDHSMTLFAVWRDAAFNITYTWNGQTVVDTKPYQQSYTIRGNDVFFFEGHAIAGWSTTEGSLIWDYRPGNIYTTDADLTLYPVWATLTVIVKFDPAGGQCATTERAFIYGEELDLPDPTRYGFTFLGWYTAEHGGTRINEGDPSPFYKVGTTLYAHWEAQPSTGKHRLLAYIKKDGEMKRAFVYVGDDDPTPRRGYIL